MRTFLRRLLAIVIMGVLVVGVAVVMTAPEPPQRTGGSGGGGGGGGGGGRRLVTPQGPVPVLVAQAAIADVPLYLEGVGTTRAFNLVTVHSQVDGKLISVNFREGEDVRRGDVLARIDPRRSLIRRLPRSSSTRRSSPMSSSISSATPI